MMPIHLPPAVKRWITNTSDFSWAPDSSLNYLGIHLFALTAKTCQLNYDSLYRKIETQRKENAKPLISWAGRVSIVNMFMFPNILYLFQALPILLSNTYFHSLEALPTKFLWNNRKPRLRANILTFSTSEAGLGAPHVYTYYKGVLLDHLQHWWKGTLDKLWVQIESAALGFPLKTFLSLMLLRFVPPSSSLSVVQTAMKLWNTVGLWAKRPNTWSTGFLPLTSLEPVTSDL